MKQFDMTITNQCLRCCAEVPRFTYYCEKCEALNEHCEDCGDTVEVEEGDYD